MSPHHFQVHPEGKFVVDVDKNIDINDVSIVVVVVLLIIVAKYLHSFPIVVFIRTRFSEQNICKKKHCPFNL